MNVWKAIAVASTIGLVGSIGIQVAAANVCHNQPNMGSALSSLRAARASLAVAEHNKGGWRTAALAAADKAIHETERGCAFAR